MFQKKHLNPRAKEFIPTISLNQNMNTEGNNILHSTETMQANQTTQTDMPNTYISNIQNTNTDLLALTHFMNTNKQNGKDLNDIRTDLFKIGIKSFYDEDRMIFTATRSNKTAHMNLFSSECNGLILSTADWAPLVIPPRTLRYNFNHDTCNKWLQKGLYHIYDAEDGTCFNMYYYKDQWLISTSNGLDVGNKTWEDVHSTLLNNTILTYKEVISECLVKNDITWDNFISKLDKTYCYSFGFKHPAMHPFYEGQSTPIYKFWFIQSICLNKESPNYMWSYDTPIIPENADHIIKNMKHQELSKVGVVSDIKELIKIAEDMLPKYINSLEKKEESISIHYGFILRSVNFEITGNHSDIYIESSLLREIRKFWYNNNTVVKCKTNKWNKTNTTILLAFLDSRSNENFTLLFPQYMDVFHSYGNITNSIIKYVCGLLYKEKPEIDSKLTSVADSVFQQFKLDVDYNPNIMPRYYTNKIVSMYVYQKKMMPLLQTVME
jgi:hypothetical protein